MKTEIKSNEKFIISLKDGASMGYSIRMSNSLLIKQQAITKHVDTEIAWLGTADVLEDKKTFVVDKLYIPPQLVDGASVNVTKEMFADFIESFTKEGKFEEFSKTIYPRLRYWGHSHVNMPVFISDVDEKGIIALGEDSSFFLSCVFNKRQEIIGRIDLFSPIRIAIECPVIAIIDELDDQTVEEIKEKVTKKSYAPPTPWVNPTQDEDLDLFPGYFEKPKVAKGFDQDTYILPSLRTRAYELRNNYETFTLQQLVSFVIHKDGLKCSGKDALVEALRNYYSGDVPFERMLFVESGTVGKYLASMIVAMFQANPDKEMLYIMDSPLSALPSIQATSAGNDLLKSISENIHLAKDSGRACNIKNIKSNVEKEFYKDAFSRVSAPFSMYDIAASFGTEALYSTKKIFVPSYLSVGDTEKQQEDSISVKYLVRSLYDSDNHLLDKLKVSFQSIRGIGNFTLEEERLIYKFALCGMFTEEVLILMSKTSASKRIEVISEPIMLQTIKSIESIIRGTASSLDLTGIAAFSYSLLPLMKNGIPLSDVEDECSTEDTLLKYIKTIGLKNSSLISIVRHEPVKLAKSIS